MLVEGETGTGKELAALLLHRKGPRSGRPFAAVDCGAQFEAYAIRDGLASAEGDIAATLALLRIPRKTLYDKILRRGIAPKAYRN